MGLAPLLWLAIRRERRPDWWWLAVAYGISWLADTAAHLWGHPWFVSAVYPVSQAALIGAVLLPRPDADWFVGVLVVGGVLGIAREGTTHPSLLLHTVAFGGIVAISWQHPHQRLRLALLVSFGLGLLAWVVFTRWVTWGTWGAYQLVRATGIGVFCWASMNPHPPLRLA